MLRVQSQEHCEDKFALFYRVCLQIIHHKHCVPVRKPSIWRKQFAGIHRKTTNNMQGSHTEGRKWKYCLKMPVQSNLCHGGISAI
ncbi:hypothetical protein AMELA_G00195690 [Ameiurus melas]|uniref:Uncharacterized protein n=1 Tax=Ameiurus melas TaxID=219545 RepID=A0A7J6A5U7_AMEME|nr:hypothetical protein AMELA_G00195690 [Ameiurus melas]